MTKRSQLAPSRARAPEKEASRPLPAPQSLFSRERAEAILALVRRGNFQQVAAQACGISERTLHDWKAKGHADPSGPFGQFAIDMDTALADAETDLVEVIRASAATEPNDAKWLLERTRPDRWKPRAEVKHETSLPDLIAALIAESNPK